MFCRVLSGRLIDVRGMIAAETEIERVGESETAKMALPGEIVERLS
jgi:hypothetical protein